MSNLAKVLSNDELNEQSNIESNDDLDTLFSDETTNTLKSEEYPFSLSLRRNDIDDEKELTKFIRSCENMVRHSNEYKLWTSYIKEVLGYKTCQVTGENNDETRVELHHHPYTLFDWIKGIILKYAESGKEFCSFDITLEVIELHFKHKVPFCLLVKSIHEKYHNGFIEIPMEIVKGDYDYFIQNILSYFPETDLESITKKLSINKENCGWNKEKYDWSNIVTPTKEQ